MSETGTAARRPRRLAWAVGTMALALALAEAPAEAAPQGMSVARFSVTVSGSQTSDWTVDHTRYDGCVDGMLHSSGAGRERLTFASRRAVRIEAIRIGEDVMLSAGTGGIPVRGTIERQGTFTVDQLSGGPSGCGDAPEGVTPPPPDCGARRWTGSMNPILHAPGQMPVAYPFLQTTDALELNGPDLPEGRHPNELFANCPGTDALLEPTHTAELLTRHLFSRKPRIVVRGRETVEKVEEGHKETAVVAWRAVFKRRGAVRYVPARQVPGGPGRPPGGAR